MTDAYAMVVRCLERQNAEFAVWTCKCGAEMPSSRFRCVVCAIHFDMDPPDPEPEDTSVWTNG